MDPLLSSDTFTTKCAINPSNQHQIMELKIKSAGVQTNVTFFQCARNLEIVPMCVL